MLPLFFMRHLRTLFNLIIAFFLGAFLATALTFTALSYYAVEHLLLATPLNSAKPLEKKPLDPDSIPKTTWINDNVLDVVRFGDQYAQELNQFDELKKEISSHKSPPLCDILCNPSSFDKDRMLEERTSYLQSFYRQNGARALQDPNFQLKIRELSILSNIYSPPFREIWLEVARHRQPPPPPWSQKLLWSLDFQRAFVVEAPGLKTKWAHLNNESDRIQSLRDLIQSCQKGLRPAKQLRADCEKL